jgi:magnesium-transporting ATPase (P-type)
VRRGGRALTIPTPEVVRGDVVELAAGDRVPADVVLLEAASLAVDEALLTGESVPPRRQPVEPPRGAPPSVIARARRSPGPLSSGGRALES